MAVRLSIGASRWQVVRQLLTESALLAAIGGALGLVVARWSLTGIIALIPREDTSFMSDRLDPDDADLHGGGGDRDRPALRAVPGAPQHPARSRLGDQEHRRPAVRRPRRLALPDRPGDHPDRALDDAADPRRAVHQEPDEPQPRRAGHRDRAAGHVRAVARSQRLHAGAIEGAVRAGRGRARRGAGRQRRRRGARAAAGRQQLGQRRLGAGLRRRDRTPTPTRCTTRSAPATSAPSACASSAAATSPAATSRAGPRWRSSTRRSRASST